MARLEGGAPPKNLTRAKRVATWHDAPDIGMMRQCGRPTFDLALEEQGLDNVDVRQVLPGRQERVVKNEDVTFCSDFGNCCDQILDGIVEAAEMHGRCHTLRQGQALTVAKRSRIVE